MSKIIITPLGTVSPYPKGDMNCPGFLVEYNDKKILLDCGNGITRLLSFPDDLKNLYVIVSHYHKDHFSDIGAIQYASYAYHEHGLLKEKVKVYLPKEEYSSNKKAIIENKNCFVDYFDIDDNSSISIDDLKISFEDNKSHSINSYMIKLENTSFKIVYTSDVGTTNLDGLSSFCRDADLIISESSFLEKHNSNVKTHLTAYDAGLIAKKANAKKLLLTHFWPEEDKKEYLKEAKEIFDNTFIAIENKKIIIGE